MIHFRGCPQFSPETLAIWTAVIEVLGKPCFDGEDGATGENNGTMWGDVRYDAALDYTFRHSATAQPLHTDGAYNSRPAELIFFICQRDATAGGETIFAGAEIVDALAREHDRELHAQMWELPIPHEKGGAPGSSVPVLQNDNQGLLLNWNYYRVVAAASSAVDKFRERFQTFLRDQIIAKRRFEAVRLLPGEVMFIKDRRVLHGRLSFTPSPRCLWKCSLDRHPGI